MAAAAAASAAAPTPEEVAQVPCARSKEGRALRARFQYGLQNVLTEEERRTLEDVAHGKGKAFLLALFARYKDLKTTLNIAVELEKQTFLLRKKGATSLSMNELAQRFGPAAAARKAEPCIRAGRVTKDEDFPTDTELFLYEIGTGRQSEWTLTWILGVSKGSRVGSIRALFRAYWFRVLAKGPVKGPTRCCLLGYYLLGVSGCSEQRLGLIGGPGKGPACIIRLVVGIRPGVLPLIVTL